MKTRDSEVRYEWSIEMGDDQARYQAEESKHSLGLVFSLWLREYGDISEWENAALFGRIIYRYSDLSVPVVAVWLGIDPSTIWEVDIPVSAPPWEFTGPTGEPLTIDREIIKSEGNH